MVEIIGFFLVDINHEWWYKGTMENGDDKMTYDDLWTKLAARAYHNTDPLPIKPRKPVLNTQTATPDEVRTYADQLETYNSRLLKYDFDMMVYLERSVALEAEFRKDLEVSHNMVDHPKADLLYGKAYERGRAPSEVAMAYADMVQLVM